MCACFLVDQLCHADHQVVSIQDRHAADRVRSVACFVIHFFVESRILETNEAREKPKEEEDGQVQNAPCRPGHDLSPITLESRMHIYGSDNKEERENAQRTGDPDVMISLQ